MKIHRSPTLFAAAVLACAAFAAFPGPQDADETPFAGTAYDELRGEAEAFYAEGSYARAHELYRDASELVDDEAERRWIAFRLADTRWRSSADSAVQEEARRQLEELVRAGNEDASQRDRVWIEGRESLGDFYWLRPDRKNWGSAWPHYQAALDAWAGHSDLELARRRYLDVVWRVADAQERGPYAHYGRYSFLPLDTLDNALKIARDAGERARARYLIAMTLKLQGQWQSRLVREFEAALEEGKGTAWYDDALFHYADFLTNWSRTVRRPDGGSRQVRDYRRAAELFRRFLDEHEKGETAYYDQARQRLEEITGPRLGVHLGQVFLPGSEVEYHLTWRNVKTIELTLHAVDLGRDVRLDGDSSYGGWQQRLDVAGRPALKAWTFDTGDRADHEPGQRILRLAETPEPGAYVLVARSGEQSAQELVLVTDAAVVVRTSGSKTLVYVCDALDGSPIAGADVRVRERLHEGNEWTWRERSLRSGEDGLAVYEGSGRELLVTASAGGRQAYAGTYRGSGSGSRAAWRVYAFTDRPAYRPSETMSFKLLARRDDGGKYSTPAGALLRYEITDPRGSKVSSAELELNAFGSAWAELLLTPEMPLGLYRVSFSENGRGIGTANLFRLEEYKLPELRISVETPEEEGRKKTFRVGERVEVEVMAEYYFGGPAGGADVALLIYQKPFYPWWSPPRPFPWFYEARQRYGGYGYGPGQLLETKQGKTDAQGRARFAFEASQNLGNDFEYRVEARVVDSSRREVTGSGTVRVTRQRYFVYPRARHNLYRPGDRVTVEIKALDPNDEGVAAAGTVRVTRDRWLERGYEHEEVLETTLRTDGEGRAELSFEAAEEGYYRIAWTSEEDDDFPVRGETCVWVATRETRNVGYHHDGVDVLVDRDTFRAGETAPLLLSTAASGRWVLLSIEGEGLLDYRLVHVEGTVKLLTLEIDESYVPNVFLNALLVEDGHLAMDVEEVVVPPVEHFLEVEVEADREAYEPREKGYLTVTTRDHEGRPVSAEVALALVDEAVFYIQDDLAGDPRQFFFGEKRHSRVRTASSFDERPYGRLEKGREENEAKEGGMRFVGGNLPAARMLSDAMAPAGMEMAKSELRRDLASAMPSRKKKADADAPAQEDAVQVRTDFRATVLWRPDVVTGEDGRARVEMTFPDSLTTWKATARAAGRGSRFGIAESSARTRMPLIVRLQAPRFFVVGDRVTISAVLNNSTDEPMRVSPALEAEGLKLVGKAAGPVTVPAGGEARVDYLVVAEAPGTARLTASGRGGRYADAMRKDYPVYEHGLTKRETLAGKARGEETTVVLDLPTERRSTRLVVQLAPSLATTMLDALPYLVDYPYGCTEQTMSRFLPAVLVAKTLSELGIEPSAIEGRLFGGVEAESRDKTHPDGKKDLGELDAMVEKGLARLYDFQHSDGGWGWWKDGDSDHFMTAYVVWGLVLARQAGISVEESAVARAVGFLEQEIVEAERQVDLQAWMLHALGRHHALTRRGQLSAPVSRALENLWERRESLSAYSRALLAIAAHDLDDGEKASVLARNLENGAVVDRPTSSSVVPEAGASHAGEMETVHWGKDGFYWRWHNGPVESTAFVLQAFLAIDPEHPLVEPAMSWLVKNRRGAQWSNTRDTAITLMALLDYLRRSGELASDQEVELYVNGRRVATRRFAATDVLAAPGRFPIDTRHLRDGGNEIRIVRRGEGALYFAVQAEYVSLEEPVTPAGHEIFVKRRYSKLVARPTLLKGIVYDKVPLEDGGTVTSGERVEVVLTVEAKNDYEYLIFEDLKPAGFEAVEIRSGTPLWARELGSDGKKTGSRRWVYQELRDRKVALFVDKLPQGVWELSYELRAEVPGEFHALPVLAEAMYVPEIRANGREIRVTVADRVRSGGKGEGNRDNGRP